MKTEFNNIPSDSGKLKGRALQKLLIGDLLHEEIPDPIELASAAIDLAMGIRPKALIPLANAPIEYAFVKRGDSVLVSCYETASPPIVHQLDREVCLRSLLNTCAQTLLDDTYHQSDPTSRPIAMRMAKRALGTKIAPTSKRKAVPIHQLGGQLEPPKESVPLAFGYETAIYPSFCTESSRSSRADVHALLFEGHLWAFMHGSKLTLEKGPIMLTAHRMVAAVRTLLDRCNHDRPTHVRLCSGHFQVTMHMDSLQKVSIGMGSELYGERTVTSLTLSEAVLPILKLTSELLRSLVTADCQQTRNLRVRSLRQEVWQLRRAIRNRRGPTSLLNTEPDRLRIHHREKSSLPTPHTPTLTSLHFEEKWRASLDGIDADSVFMCNDRLIVATPNDLLAIDRNHGETIWRQPGPAATTLLTHSTVIRVLHDGEVELCSVKNGKTFSTTHITPPPNGFNNGLMTGGGTVPHVAILPDGSDRLVAIDMQTGEPRWRFKSTPGCQFRMTKFGRVLLVTCEEEAIHALDIVSGEDLWRFASHAQFDTQPLVNHKTVITTARHDKRHGVLFGLDPYSGQRLWEHELHDYPMSHIYAVGRVVVLPTMDSRGSHLTAYDVQTGELAWKMHDPGLSLGGAGLSLDDIWIVNAPFGQVTGVDLQKGEVIWELILADALIDEIPRHLEPVLRGGVLFIPAASVHVIQPKTGQRLSANLPCEFVPDIMRVDERGWIYIAEESGSLMAFAPKPTLTLLQGGNASIHHA